MDVTVSNLSTPPSLLRLPNVLARVGMSRSQVYQLMARGEFPRAVALTPRIVAWRDDEIGEWVNSRPRANKSAA